VPSLLQGWDKLAHAGLYTILGATLGYGRYYAVPSPPHWLLIGMGALYGATDEWHQGFVRGRSPDLGDWMADVTGVVVGYVALLFVLGWRARRKGPGEEGADVRS
jgi:VanZ family protein